VSREMVFTMRMNEADKRRLRALAEHYCAPCATVVRILIKERHDQIKTMARRVLTQTG